MFVCYILIRLILLFVKFIKMFVWYGDINFFECRYIMILDWYYDNIKKY